MVSNTRMRRTGFAVTALAAALIAVPTHAWTKEVDPRAGARPPEKAGHTPTDGWLLDGRFGPGFLLRSRSKVPRHLFKPTLRLGARRPVWSPRLEVGAALDALLSPNEHYRVLGALAHARFAAVDGTRFSLGVGAGLGAGYAADILSEDLTADGPVAPYGFVALDGRWRLGRSLRLGVEAAHANLAIVHLGVVIGWRM